MPFDSNSIKKLSALSKQLENPSKEPIKSSNKEKASLSRLHPIETEENPEKLFKELIKASADGKVPSHLIERLKELENKQLHKGISFDGNTLNNITPNPPSKNKTDPLISDLYTSFQMLLLEED